MKKEFVFIGDSLTWCQDPITGVRSHKENRWTTMVDNQFENIKMNFHGIPGLALDIKPWDLESDFCTSSKENMFFEKVILTHDPEVTDVFIFIGFNNFQPTYGQPKTAKEIPLRILELVKRIKTFFPNVNVHVMTMPNYKFKNKFFSFSDFNEQLKFVMKQYGIPTIDLLSLEVNSNDGVHFGVKENTEMANIVSNYIEKALNK